MGRYALKRIFQGVITVWFIATATFFEQPRHMAHHHRELFDALRAYYRVDPREWRRE